jgi:hypothetical protein
MGNPLVIQTAVSMIYEGIARDAGEIRFSTASVREHLRQDLC